MDEVDVSWAGLGWYCILARARVENFVWAGLVRDEGWVGGVLTIPKNSRI